MPARETLRRQLTPLEPLVRRLESAGILDAPGRLAGRRVRGLIGGGAIKEALSGSWLGHALHPLLTDVVIGSFVSASLLDVVGGEDARPASERLIAARHCRLRADGPDRSKRLGR